MGLSSVVVVVALAFVVGVLAPAILKKDDTAIEQAAEAVLRDRGIDIDFSPDSEDENEE